MHEPLTKVFAKAWLDNLTSIFNQQRFRTVVFQIHTGIICRR